MLSKEVVTLMNFVAVVYEERKSGHLKGRLETDAFGQKLEYLILRF